MKRIVTVLAVAALMAAVKLVAGAGYAFGYVNPDNNGNAANAPG